MATTAQKRYAEIMRDVEELINDHSGIAARLHFASAKAP